MNLRRCAALIVAVGLSPGHSPASAVTFAQTGFAGTWQADVADAGKPWTMFLKVDGTRVDGAVSSCASLGGPIAILDGRVDGATLTFKCMSGDQQRTVTTNSDLTLTA